MILLLFFLFLSLFSYNLIGAIHCSSALAFIFNSEDLSIPVSLIFIFDLPLESEISYSLLKERLSILFFGFLCLLKFWSVLF